jgi:signal transduction histidine kinase
VERRFRASQEASLQGYAQFSAMHDEAGAIRDFRWEYINPRGAAMARSKPEDLVGRGLRETLPATVTSGVIDTFAQVIATGEPRDREGRYDRSDGDGWFRYMVVKVGGGLQVSFFDISETKRLERQLRERAHELARSDSQKSEFLAMLSHELRNPLAPILNGLTLLDRQKDPRALASTREMMGRQIRNLRRLIDDLLDMSRIDRGKLELVRERVAVDTIMRNALETAQPAIEGKLQQLVVQQDAAGWYVDGDPLRLAQIVSNLVGNASKFTPDSGRIDVRVEGAGQEVRVTVTDNGMGFTPGDEERIFDMFVQLEGGRVAGPGGLGLGLALARRLAQLHGGSLVAQSAGRGHGATFMLRLPATRVAPDALADTIPIDVKATRRVIVVDDNADAADSLAQVLALEGFDVRAYHDPVHALGAADEFMPDVAFLDLNMPGMTGIELGRQLRARPWGAALRLVAVTGMGQAADLAATREAGFNAHVTKPAPTRRIVALACDSGD